MQEEIPAAAPLNPSIVFDMVQAHQRTAALKAAIQLDVFRSGRARARKMWRRLHDIDSSSEKGIRILCDFLVINGVLAKQDGHYKHTPTSAAFLDPTSPACMASVAYFLSESAVMQADGQLAEIVRAGRTHLPGSGTVEPDNPIWVSFAENMAPMMGPMAAPLGAMVLKGSTEPMRVLDIAAGHGLFGIEIAKQNPNAHVTGLDWGPVLNVAKRNAREGWGSRIATTCCQEAAFDVDFGGPYDVVLLTNFLHHFDKPTNIDLLRKVRAALKTGGCATTLEFVPNPDRVSPPMPAAFAMTMLTTTADGDAYTFAELEAMYADAGFTEISENPIPMSPHTVVLGVA